MHKHQIIILTNKDACIEKNRNIPEILSPRASIPDWERSRHWRGSEAARSDEAEAGLGCWRSSDWAVLITRGLHGGFLADLILVKYKNVLI